MLLSLALVLAQATAAPPALPSNCASAAGFAGTICTPEQTGRRPLIVLLGGSEGGNMMAYTAPRFAAAGYVAASVAYFGLPGLPPVLQDIPVETVGNALAVLSKRPDVDPSRIAIFGVSKGGEFALLAASVYPQIRAVIADVPSPFAWESIPQGAVTTPESSWTVGGKPLPFVPYTSAMGTSVFQAFQEHKPMDLRPAYVDAEKNSAAVQAAMFHLERIAGPVLCVGADDDQIWDSDAQCAIAARYLSAHHHPYADTFEHYAGAGHLFLFSSPARPFVQAGEGPVQLLLGGTPAANVAAAHLAWPRIIAFLGTSLQPARTP